jgi:hypothetical protein
MTWLTVTTKGRLESRPLRGGRLALRGSDSKTGQAAVLLGILGRSLAITPSSKSYNVALGLFKRAISHRPVWATDRFLELIPRCIFRIILIRHYDCVCIMLQTSKNNFVIPRSMRRNI